MTFNLVELLDTQTESTDPRAGDDVGPHGRAGLALSGVKPAPEAARDSEQRPSSVAKLDTENRLSATKVAAVLKWAPGTTLVAEVDRTGLVPAVVLRAAPVTAPHQHAVPLDKAGRVRLAPPLVGALQLSPGAQVWLVALPQRNQVALYALDDVAPVITAALCPPLTLSTPGEPVAAPEPPARRTNVRRPWTAPAAVAS